MFEFFSPSGSHTILVYRSYTDTKHRAASLRQQSVVIYASGSGRHALLMSHIMLVPPESPLTNSPLKIYCCYFVCTADARSVSDS